MDLKQIQDILKLVADSGVAEVEIEEDGFKLVIRTQVPTVQVQPPAYFPPPPPGYAPPAYPAPVAPPAPAAHAPLPPAPAAAAPAEAAPPAPAAPKGQVQKAPIVGTFYAASSPDADPFVKVGDRVRVGQVLCIIEAMKLMNEIESEVAGTITQILVDNGEPVEYDQPLFEIATD